MIKDVPSIKVHYIELKDVPISIIKHFNHDFTSAKALSVIRFFILKGVEFDRQLKMEMEDRQRQLEDNFQWLNQFWEKHKEEFYARGFKDTLYIAHPLFGAYNELAIEQAYLKDPKLQNPFQLVDHILDGKQTTGPLSMDNIAESIRCSIKDTKIALSKLESLGVIGRAFNKNLPPYWYWINDENYLL